MFYQFLHIQDLEKPGSAGLIEAVATSIDDQVRAQSHEIFGTFVTLLGLASNEIYLVTFGEQPFRAAPPDFVLPARFSVLRSITFTPTLRPEVHQPLTRTGVYVFRWFKVNPDAVDEIIRLSGAAWPTFEANFETQVQGLFKGEDPADMLLVTWYQNLGAWEASRHPPPAARDNFLRRHQLTLSATPIATMLASRDANPLVSHT